MSLQFSTAVRDAMLDAIQYGANSGQTTAIGPNAVIRFWTGAVPANCAAADTSTKIAEFDLAASWAAAAAADAKPLTGVPLTVQAVAAGTLGYFHIYATGGATCHLQGTITRPAAAAISPSTIPTSGSISTSTSPGSP
jgi:hypothetical protein